MKPGGRLLASALIALAGALETAWLSIAWLKKGWFHARITRATAECAGLN